MYEKGWCLEEYLENTGGNVGVYLDKQSNQQR